MIRTLGNAAGVLESIGWNPVTPGDGEPLGVSPGTPGLPSVNELAASLRLYTWILEMAGDRNLSKSPVIDLVKYALIGYVENKTGTPHDKEVSALIGAALRDTDYTEASHKMWRFRNFERLQGSLPQLLQFLSAFEILITSEK